LDRRHPGIVVYNGIDMMRFQPAPIRDEQWRRRWGIPAEATVIGQVGALAANKRPDFLVSAFGSLLKQKQHAFHLCLVGAGPLEASLRQLVDQLGIASHVSLTGYVGDVLPYYQHVFDINVLASSEEGLGISVIEGSACGLPAVVSNCTGLPETIVGGTTGFLFELNDAAGLSGHLLRLGTDPPLRASMGQAGRAFAEERFSSTAYDRSFMMAVDDLLNSR
jgi:glycosyltransferase involved in cell wall biosynthesis